MTTEIHGDGGEHRCPEFLPSLWDEQTFSWQDKPFIMGRVPQFLHRPLPGRFAKTVMALWTAALQAGAAPKAGEALFLASDPSPWSSEIYLNVTRPVAGARNVTMSGHFFSRVFDGPYSAVPRYIRSLDESLAATGRSAERYFFHFPYCPACAQRYGHNYALAVARLAEA